MWPDNETTEDLIGFQVHADLIRAVITNPAMLPTTIGIFGDWGGGKTSVLRMLEKNLSADTWPQASRERERYESVAVVYVNTWQFEGYDDAKAALLSSILLELSEHKKFGPRVRDAAKSLLRRVNWMRVTRFAMKNLAVPAAAYATGGMSLLPAGIAAALGFTAIDAVEPGSDPPGTAEAPDLIVSDAPQGPMDIRTFQGMFDKMLKDGGISTLIVLVDDLDRCTPERIIDNLEAVKLFLSTKSTAFVIAADRRIVEHAIRTRYAARSESLSNDEQTQRLVKDYLEKLVQVPYSLPRLSSTEIETYMTLLFCGQHQQADDYSECVTACNTHRATNRYASFGYAAVKAAMNGRRIKAELSEALTLAATAAPLISDGLKGNPRQVKRFLNALLLRKQLAEVALLQNIRDSVLVKLMILEYVHPELFAQLFNWQAYQEGTPHQLRDLELILSGTDGDINNEDAARAIDPKWATTSVRQWVAMEPMLREVDLRDYFWVARDKLQSVFSGISMVAPAVRTVLDGLLSSAIPKQRSATLTALKLGEDERASLLALLQQKITRQLDDKSGYDAIRFLVEANVPGALEILCHILANNPLESVPAAAAMDFMTLTKARPEQASIWQSARDRLIESPTQAGRAAQAAAPKPKR